MDVIKLVSWLDIDYTHSRVYEIQEDFGKLLPDYLGVGSKILIHKHNNLYGILDLDILWSGKEYAYAWVISATREDFDSLDFDVID